MWTMLYYAMDQGEESQRWLFVVMNCKDSGLYGDEPGNFFEHRSTYPPIYTNTALAGVIRLLSTVCRIASAVSQSHHTRWQALLIANFSSCISCSRSRPSDRQHEVCVFAGKDQERTREKNWSMAGSWETQTMEPLFWESLHVSFRAFVKSRFRSEHNARQSLLSNV